MPNGTCSVDYCDRPSHTRGWCQAHYFRWRRNGSLGDTPVFTPGTRTCEMDGCERKHFGEGLCNMHWQRMRKWGDPEYVSPPKWGEANTEWRGDEVGYGSAHERVRNAKGSARNYDCAHCGDPASQWAYDHQDPDVKYERMGTSEVPYSPDVDHYQPMCVPCHKTMDIAIIRAHGMVG